MAHEHPVLDTDRKFTIDPYTRIITNATETKLHLVQYDHNSERFTFEIPRYVEEHDMSLCNRVEVHYLNTGNAGRKSDVYPVEDMAVSEEDDNKVEFSWLVSQNATRIAGSLNFVVKFKCMEEDIITYSWSTTVFAGIKVGDGLDNTESVAEQYSDVLENWLKTIVDTKINSVEDIEFLRDNSLAAIREAANAIDADGAVQIVKDAAADAVAESVDDAKVLIQQAGQEVQETIDADVDAAVERAVVYAQGSITLSSDNWFEYTEDDGFGGQLITGKYEQAVFDNTYFIDGNTILFTPLSGADKTSASACGLILIGAGNGVVVFVADKIPMVDISLAYTVSGIQKKEA